MEIQPSTSPKHDLNRSFPQFSSAFLERERERCSCFPKSLSSIFQICYRVSLSFCSIFLQRKTRPQGEGKTQRKLDDYGGGGCETRRFRSLFYRVPNSAMPNENNGYDSSFSNHFITQPLQLHFFF